MFNWIFNRHKHEWSHWEVVKALIDQYGNSKVIQKRTCTTCGYTQTDAQEN